MQLLFFDKSCTLELTTVFHCLALLELHRQRIIFSSGIGKFISILIWAEHSLISIKQFRFKLLSLKFFFRRIASLVWHVRREKTWIAKRSARPTEKWDVNTEAGRWLTASCCELLRNISNIFSFFVILGNFSRALCSRILGIGRILRRHLALCKLFQVWIVNIKLLVERSTA